MWWDVHTAACFPIQKNSSYLVCRERRNQHLNQNDSYLTGIYYFSSGKKFHDNYNLPENFYHLIKAMRKITLPMFISNAYVYCWRISTFRMQSLLSSAVAFTTCISLLWKMNPVCLSFVNRNSVWCSGDGVGVYRWEWTPPISSSPWLSFLPGDFGGKALIPGFLGRRREMSLSFPCGKVSFFFLSSSKPFLSSSKPLNPLLSEYQITEFSIST